MRVSFLVLLMAASVSQVPGAIDHASLMTRGRTALEAEDYESAREALERAVALRPTDPEARYALAIAYSRQKQYRLATDQLELVIRMSPDHADALAELGAIASAFGRFEEAVARYRSAVQVDPAPARRRGLAGALARQGKLDEATRVLDSLLLEDPSDTESQYTMGLVLMREGDCAGATGRFRAVLRFDPDHTGALFNLGNCLSRDGRSDEADRTLSMFRRSAGEKEARIDRRRRTLLLLQEADGLLRRPDVEGALKVIDEAIRINPDDFKPHAFKGQVLESKGDIRGALASFTRAAELNPLDPVILVEAGRLHGMSGRFRDAIPYLSKAADIAPLMAEPHLLLAASYRELGRAGDAAREERTYRRLMAVSAETPTRTDGL